MNGSKTAERSEVSVAAETENGVMTLNSTGAWVVANAAAMEAALDRAFSEKLTPSDITFDVQVDALDTAGAWLLVRKQRVVEADQATVTVRAAAPSHQRLIERVAATPVEAPPRTRRAPFFVRPFENLGRAIAGMGTDVVDAQAVQGRILGAGGAVLSMRNPLRVTAFTNQFDQIVYRAVPIVVLISLVVGAIVTQQSILQLRNFGASIFVVDLSAILMLREVGLLLASIMIAGRSGSAITAEIGSMRMREEIDALTVMGVDPYQALILPRMLALVIGLPLLAFIGAIAGLTGAAVVSNVYGGIGFETFLSRLQDTLTLPMVVVGLVKAPVMAFIIGLIATNEGLKVEGSAESLGRHTTASVVKSIFMVIVADGLFAVFFAAIGV